MNPTTVTEREPQPNNPDRPDRAASYCPTTSDGIDEGKIMNTVTEQGPQPNNPDRSTPDVSAWPASRTPFGGPGYQPLETHNALRGRDLRYVLTSYIQQGHRTISELAQQLAADGYTVWGRASKVISDALRWEIRNRRVRRIRRGVYAIDTIPRSTGYRIAARVRQSFFASHVVAIRRDTTNHDVRTPRTPPPTADRHWQEWRKTGPNRQRSRW